MCLAILQHSSLEVLPTLPEPVLRLALERISTTPGFADNDGDFYGDFRKVWREVEALALDRRRGYARAPVGLIRLVAETLNFQPDETLYVPHAEDGFAAAEL